MPNFLWPSLPAALLSISAQAAVPELTFREALDEILRRSTDVASQQAQLEAAQARALPVRLRFAPDLNVSGQLSRARIEGADLNGKKLEAVSTLNLFRFGGDLAALHSVDRDIETEEARLLDQQLSIEEKGVQALVVRIQRELETDVARRLVSMQTEFLKIARERYERGLLALQEVEKLSIDLENARSRLTDAELATLASEATLETLLGQRKVKSEWPWKDWFGKASALEALSKRELELGALPEVRAARLRLEAEDSRLSAAKAQILPRLDASLAYGYYDGAAASSAGGSYTSWTGALTATLPLFDRLANYSASRVQAAARQGAELAAEQAEREARAGWGQAREGFKTSVQAALARERTLATSRKLFQDGLRRFRAGRSAANELNVDQQRLLDSELFAVQGWGAVHVAYARLCRALGSSVWRCLGSH